MSTKTKHAEVTNTQHISTETETINKSVPNRKMRLRRKKRKSLKHGKPTTPVPLTIRRDNALSYLHLWNDDKDTWSFKKNTQYWLLNNMYDKKQVNIYIHHIYIHVLHHLIYVHVLHHSYMYMYFIISYMYMYFIISYMYMSNV